MNGIDLFYAMGGIDEDLIVRADTKIQVSNTNLKMLKISFLAAAIAVIISLISFFAVASRNDINIKNGVVTYLSNAISIRFFGVDNEEKILSASDIELDLQQHGFDDVKIPKFLLTDDWENKEPRYLQTDFCNQVTLKFINDDILISVGIGDVINEDMKFPNLKNATTVNSRGLDVHVFDHGNNTSQMIYFLNGYQYDIVSYVPYEQMIEYAKNVN